MITATKEYLRELEALSDKRKNEILNSPDKTEVTGTKYFVSADGDDGNDGLTEATAWRTLPRVSGAELAAGDGVFFRRGDVFCGMFYAKSGVTYGAYGEGAKPEFHSFHSLADPAMWELYDKEHRIWHLKEKILDVGTLIFNGGEQHSYKLIPSYRYGRFVCRDDVEKPFDMRAEMKRDLDIFWHYDERLTETGEKFGESFPIPLLDAEAFGDLYLRCDRGNPGGAFRELEAAVRLAVIRVGTEHNVHIDNLAIKYTNFGISQGGLRVTGLHVTNCVLGWIGGCIQSYFGDDPNFPEDRRGSVTRYGNGIEIYGGCDDFLVENCWCYEIYDAAMSHQRTTRGQKTLMTNVTYKDNLCERCVYSIEYFLDMTEGDTESYMENIEMCGNILRFSGYGWGQQRHNFYTPAHIKGWSYVNKARNYRIHHNIFDRAAYRLIHTVAKEAESCPEMYANTYVQYYGNNIGKYGGNSISEPDDIVMDECADEAIARVFGEKDATVVVIK